MPRQLPWKSSSGRASRTQTLKPPMGKTKTKTTTISHDFADNSLGGTVLASSSRDKGKGKAKVTSDSDDSLSEAETALPRTTTKPKTAGQGERGPSSSPQPLADYVAPHDEPMRKGVSNFDLRDDEWMMVEDDFLETAKLFTRHLHIAEYDRLKARIEAKKREVETARPVMAGVKRSADGEMKERARIQESRQKEAIRDVFASRRDSSEDERPSHRPKPSHISLTTPKPLPTASTSQETDSDDLDAPRPPKPRAPSPASATAPKLLPASRRRPAYLQASAPAIESFVKPALPATKVSGSRVRPSRMTPFDMLDEYTPPTDTRAPPTATSRAKSYSQSTSSNHASLQTSTPTITRAFEPRRSIDLLEDLESAKDTAGISKDVADRMAKRKVERAGQGGGKEKKKKKSADTDDIPTFLY